MADTRNQPDQPIPIYQCTPEEPYVPLYWRLRAELGEDALFVIEHRDERREPDAKMDDDMIGKGWQLFYCPACDISYVRLVDDDRNNVLMQGQVDHVADIKFDSKAKNA